MDIVFAIPIITVVIYCAVQFLDMKFVEKANKPLKIVVRDTIIVLFCSLLANFIFSNVGDSIQKFVDAITDKKTVSAGLPDVYTDVPSF
jgi:predicted PurR-regulated permease PerM